MKIAYISHHKRPNYEISWFAGMDFECVKILDTNFDSYPNDLKESVQFCKVDYRENKLYSKFFHSTALLVKYKNFEKYLEDVDVIVVLEIFSSLSKQFVKYAKSKGKKVIVLVYELITEHPIYKIFPFNLNKNYCIRHADLFVCVSNKAKDHLIGLGAPENKIRVVYPGIDLSKFNPSVKPIEKKNNKRFIFLGRLDHHKGIDLVLSAYEKCYKVDPKIELWIIGSGNYENEVKLFSRKYQNVKYFGKVENHKVASYLNSCGIYILPCRDTFKGRYKIGSEQFGFSFVEAMACGLAVLTTKCGAIPEIVTDNNVCLEQNDGDGIVSSILKLIKLKDLVEVQEKNIKIVSDKYSLEKETRSFEKEIEKVVTKE